MNEISSPNPQGGFSLGTIFLSLIVLYLSSLALSLAHFLVLFINLGMNTAVQSVLQPTQLIISILLHATVLVWTGYLAGKRSPGGEYINSAVIGILLTALCLYYLKMKDSQALEGFLAFVKDIPDWYTQSFLFLSIPTVVFGGFLAQRSNATAVEEARSSAPAY